MVQPPSEPRWPTYQAGDDSTVSDSPPPGMPAVPGQAPAPLDPRFSPQRPGYSPQDPLVLAAGSSTLRKEGAWTVPPYLRIAGDLGAVRLDFRRAQLTSEVIWVDISGGVGSIVMVVPEGWAAQADRLRPGMGSPKLRVVEETVAHFPLLVLTGSLGVGSLAVRYPNRRDERWLARQLRREQRARR
jgi:hypothetical protein